MKKILYVEDNEVNRNLVLKIFHQVYEIDTAENAIEALPKIKENFYDLFLLDINLGDGETGIDIMKHIREFSHYKDIPIIAITAYEYSKNYFLDLGFSHFISKPFTRTDIIELLKTALKNS